MGVREERRQAAREGILAAAHRQLAEGGLASASVTTVAARAGVATGSLYRHFPSRGDLLAAVVGDALRGEQALLDRAVAQTDDPTGSLKAWIATTVARARQAPVLTSALLRDPGGPELDAVRDDARARREEALRALITAGSDAGAWPHGETHLQARAIVGACQVVLSRAPARRLAGGGEGPRGAGDAQRDGAGGGEAAALARFCLGALGAATT